MAHKLNKTNALRLLDRAGISYELKEYPVDESDLSGIHVAESVGLHPGQVIKTLVLHGDKTGYLVACIPVASSLALKNLASCSGNKKVEMIPMKDLLPVTGYIRGGCSPVGMKKQFPTFMDSSVFFHDKVAFSAGIRGLQVILSPRSMQSLIHASEVHITETGSVIQEK